MSVKKTYHSLLVYRGCVINEAINVMSLPIKKTVVAVVIKKFLSNI